MPVSAAASFNPVSTHTSQNNFSAVRTLTPATDATKLKIQAFTQNLRYTLDGTVPTSTLGFQLKAADPPILIPIESGTVIKMIEETATAVAQFQWGQ